MTFSGTEGSVRSQAGNMVPGFGVSVVHNGKTLTASMTAKTSFLDIHYYIFTIVSITIYRAVSRGKDFLSVFRTR